MPGPRDPDDPAYRGGNPTDNRFRFPKPVALRTDNTGNQQYDISRFGTGWLVRFQDGDYEIYTDQQITGGDSQSASSAAQVQLGYDRLAQEAYNAAQNRALEAARVGQAGAHLGLTAQQHQQGLAEQQRQFNESFGADKAKFNIGQQFNEAVQGWRAATDSRDFQTAERWRQRADDLSRQQFAESQRQFDVRTREGDVNRDLQRGTNLLQQMQRPETLIRGLYGLGGFQAPQGAFEHLQKLPGYGANAERISPLAGASASQSPLAGTAGAGVVPTPPAPVPTQQAAEERAPRLGPKPQYAPIPAGAVWDNNQGLYKTPGAGAGLTREGFPINLGGTQQIPVPEAPVPEAPEPRYQVEGLPMPKPTSETDAFLRQFKREHGGNLAGFDRGGVVPEPVIGMGVMSGQRYMFGENGPEGVVPTEWLPQFLRQRHGSDDSVDPRPDLFGDLLNWIPRPPARSGGPRFPLRIRQVPVEKALGSLVEDYKQLVGAPFEGLHRIQASTDEYQRGSTTSPARAKANDSEIRLPPDRNLDFPEQFSRVPSTLQVTPEGRQRWGMQPEQRERGDLLYRPEQGQPFWRDRLEPRENPNSYAEGGTIGYSPFGGQRRSAYAQPQENSIYQPQNLRSLVQSPTLPGGVPNFPQLEHFTGGGESLVPSMQRLTRSAPSERALYSGALNDVFGVNSEDVFGLSQRLAPQVGRLRTPRYG